MAASKSFVEYMESYRLQHTQLGTRITHMVGIPMILASLPIAPLNPVLGGGLFVGGWVLQFIGHYVFEKNEPAFFEDKWNLLMGAIWAALEWAHVFGMDVTLPGAPAWSDAATTSHVSAAS